MIREKEIRCSGCGMRTMVGKGTRYDLETLCRPCYEAWMDLDRRASAELRKERRKWVTQAQRGEA